MPIPSVRRSKPLSKRQLHSLLSDWFQHTDEEQIGATGVQGRKAWLWVRSDGELCNLHADTTRPGVERYLELAQEHGPDLEWTVVMSAGGKLTKVAFGPEQEAIRGFYLYRE